MGRKKINPISYQNDDILRAVSYAKRKKGIIKKAVELSAMCD